MKVLFMGYDRESLINSEAAFEILRAFYNSDEEKGKYSKQIAEDTGRSKHTVSRYIKSLRDQNLIERTERTKAQYYQINIEGLIALMNKYWSEKHKEALNTDIKHLDSEDGVVDTLEGYPDIKPFEQQVYEGYIYGYFVNTSESTIKKMIYDDFQADLENTYQALKDADLADGFFDLEQANLRKRIYDVLEFNVGHLLVSALSEKGYDFDMD